MSADQRDFTNFKNFPGIINKGTNNYEFPQLFANAANGKLREWAVYVRLIKEESKKPSKTKEQNWNLLLEDQVPIKSEYLNDDFKLPEGLLAQVWSEGGYVGMKISRSAPTYPSVKNKGKKNERNVFHQALVSARGKYLKKVQEGYVEEKALDKQCLAKPTKFYVMKAKNYKDIKKIYYPVYVQPKLDGLRCIVYLDKNPKLHKVSIDDVIMYTRQKKEYPPSKDSIRKALLDVLIDYYDTGKGESVYLDGELYKHGKSLQNINSAARGSDKKLIDENEYHIYDMFYPSYTNEPFEKRIETLKSIYNSLHIKNTKIIKLVPTHIVQNKLDDDRLYKEYINKGYEGTMIRNPSGKYAKNAHVDNSALRTKDLLKRKEVFDGEYEVIGYTDGNTGKDVGALIWQCQTVDKYIFNVVPKMSLENRYALFNECKKHFIKKYKNRMLSIEYRGLSDDNVPQHAKAITFRIDQ
jgi:ATP-dependent DNA ligase